MKYRPILMNGAMVRAILAGMKTQTRRVVKPQPPAPNGRGAPYFDQHEIGGNNWLYLAGDAPSVEDIAHYKCPYGEPGDRLWVRETWAHVPATAWRRSEGVPQIVNPSDPDMAAVYAAGWDRSRPGRWRPSIHMPRWASRITLEITGVRVERLNDISERDATAEGMGSPILRDCKVPKFMALWESINGPGSWDANPWVWVIEFKRIEANP